MKYGVYSISDRLIGFNTPFIMISDEVAKREFVNSVKKNPNKNDLDLTKIGTFDDTNGNLEGWENAFEILLKGKDVAREE